jgi:hypothetical protein
VTPIRQTAAHVLYERRRLRSNHRGTGRAEPRVDKEKDRSIEDSLKGSLSTVYLLITAQCKKERSKVERKKKGKKKWK